MAVTVDRDVVLLLDPSTSHLRYPIIVATPVQTQLRDSSFSVTYSTSRGSYINAYIGRLISLLSSLRQHHSLTARCQSCTQFYFPCLRFWACIYSNACWSSGEPYTVLGTQALTSVKMTLLRVTVIATSRDLASSSLRCQLWHS